MSTAILSVLLMLTSLLCIALAWLWIDRTITLAYVNASLNLEVRSRVIMTDIIESEWYGEKEDDVYKKLMTEVKKHPEKEMVLKKSDGGENIYFENFKFNFDNGRLKKIE